MTDIVERLRAEQPIAPDDIKYEAADEIERLRKQYDDLCERTLIEYQAMRDVLEAVKDCFKQWNADLDNPDRAILREALKAAEQAVMERGHG